MTKSAPAAAWLAPAVETVATILSSASSPMNRLASCCGALGDHSRADSVLVLGPAGGRVTVLACHTYDPLVSGAAAQGAPESLLLDELRSASDEVLESHLPVLRRSLAALGGSRDALFVPMVHGGDPRAVLCCVFTSGAWSDVDLNGMRVMARMIGAADLLQTARPTDDPDPSSRLSAILNSLTGATLIVNADGAITRVIPCGPSLLPYRQRLDGLWHCEYTRDRKSVV